MRVKNIDRIQFEYYKSENFLILIDQRLRSTFDSPFHKFDIVLTCGEWWNFIWGFVTNR